ncbi:MAG: thiamine phosphate synthase [Paludibacteraceae bacterium]|nr:thiamine phosphate synthase [Paludibacteraceae bacterium]
MFSIIIITPCHTIENETIICNSLFAKGLSTLHLRKPDADESEVRHYIESVEPCYRNRIVIHSHFHLVNEYGLKGIHLKSTMISDFKKYVSVRHVSVSCHSFEEIENLTFNPSYVFISPVFDSISKPGYKANNALLDKLRISSSKVPLMALGGIDDTNVIKCRMYGFAGAAVMGYIWNNPNYALERFGVLQKPMVLSIAGFDSTSGAGVSADIKTVESCGVYAMGVVSAITFQNVCRYEGTEWIDKAIILRQMETLFKTHTVEIAKIGLIENYETLISVLKVLHKCNPNIKIIWDPIMKATASDDSFHGADLRANLGKIMDMIDLITPNTEELVDLFDDTTPAGLYKLSIDMNCAILHKGGHSNGEESCDTLYMPNGDIFQNCVIRIPFEKHGTGCFLSSAIMAYWSLGYSLPEACALAQSKTAAFISSNHTKLGYNVSEDNKIIKIEECGIMYISDYRHDCTIAEQIEAVCKGGIKWIQLRMKDSTDKDMLSVGRLVKEICNRYGATFIVNDRVEIARVLNADGVHLGKSDMNPLEARRILGKNKIIGATCNTFEDILTSSRQSVDYIGVGPFRFTTTKRNLSPVIGVDGYRMLVSRCRNSGIKTPLFAIGGITVNDFSEIMSTGVTGIALSGGILRSDDITAKAKQCIDMIKNSNNGKTNYCRKGI